MSFAWAKRITQFLRCPVGDKLDRVCTSSSAGQGPPCNQSRWIVSIRVLKKPSRAGKYLPVFALARVGYIILTAAVPKNTNSDFRRISPNLISNKNNYLSLMIWPISNSITYL